MEPYEGVLSRDNSQKKKILDLFGNLLDNVVNCGTHVFSWCVEKQPVEQANLVVAALLHHLVEILDGAAVLLREGSGDPAKLVLRGALESALGLHFLVQSDTERRAIYYRVSDVHRRRRMLRQLDPSTPEGAELEQLARSDTSGFEYRDAVFQDTAAAVADLEGRLAKDEALRTVDAEWRGLKKKTGFIPHWYSLFDGPRNVKDLAVNVGFSAWYAILYKEWSGTAHATDALERLQIDPADGSASIRGLRDPRHLQVLTSLAASMGIVTFRRVVAERVPPKTLEFDRWYQEVRNDYQRVSSEEPLFVFQSRN